ncbi:hypothetical protein IE53DRAFT_201554 [Violaceomyces palustris]|uniref:Uncharacterized protein n=1 Tax=Violaceomyces palustris TaxID=1673888 RepID=A0ACD0P5D7_9BASI|nr:hypothetical protein IE53DRAFT_201554 [Violaceomyces palustris]
MNSALTSPDAKFVLLKNLNPLCHKGGERDGLLATLSWDQVKPTITESVKLSGGDPSKGLVYGPDAFGLSLPQGQTPTERLREELESSGEYDFVDTRALARSEGWERYEAALVAQARSMIDWNERNQFCPACSRRQYSLWGGYKRGCSSALGVAAEGSEFAKPFLPPPHRSFKEDGKGFCPSTKVLSNFCYSRLDPVVIMCIISPDGEKILLGRQKSWPKGMMSCLAGFCEAGESLEESVRREVFEEAGVGVGAVIYHSTQPWPFPNSLMCGMMGVAIEGQDKIRLDLDNELEEARFFTRQEVLEALSSSTSNFSKDDLAKIDEKVRKEMEEERKAKGISEEEWTKTVEEREKTEIRRTSLRLPPPSAIAHTLVASWARKEAVIPLPPKGKM